MKAIVFHEHGTLEQVTYTDIPKPEIKANEVLVEVKAAALNRLDLWVLAGWCVVENLSIPDKICQRIGRRAGAPWPREGGKKERRQSDPELGK